MDDRGLMRILKRCRVEKQLTLFDVGQQLGLSAPAVSLLERGLRNPRRTTRIVLIHFLRTQGYQVKEERAA